MSLSGRAEARAREAAAAFTGDAQTPARVEPPRRWFAVGDPQTTPTRLFAVLERYALLGEDGFLRPDVGLVSMGDHFDFHGEPAAVERAGREVLAWLAIHARTQVLILAGNHDLSRVMELAFETDASFGEARALAAAIQSADGERRAELTEQFHARFPRIPTPGIAARDYVSFSEAQRALVETLLLEGRMQLATIASVEGATALLTHAGVTSRELAELGHREGATPEEIARSLNALLARAVNAAREAWTRGARHALDLSPAHVPGTTRREGGGLLYHRPTRRERGPEADAKWEFDAERPRRFEPHALPAHLVQVVGHTGHAHCRRELATWLDESARAEALAIRTLARGTDGPRYRAGVHAAPGNLILVDPGFAKAPLETIELLSLGPPRLDIA